MPHPETVRKDGTNPDLWLVGANIYRNKFDKLEKPTYVDEFIAMAYEACAAPDPTELQLALVQLIQFVADWHNDLAAREPELVVG